MVSRPNNCLGGRAGHVGSIGPGPWPSYGEVAHVARTHSATRHREIGTKGCGQAVGCRKCVQQIVPPF